MSHFFLAAPLLSIFCKAKFADTGYANKKPRAVTARVLLELRTTGSVEKRVRVQGRLYLTHADDGWQVFGYDMTKGTV